MPVEKFHLFDPWFSLVKKEDRRYGLRYRLAALGGYVKISGMIDESMDKETMKPPPQPGNSAANRPGKRLIIMMGGVTVNVILAFIIYAGIPHGLGRRPHSRTVR